ncbi:MAG: RsmE family RNA methyltransferase [Fusobacteriaceae bacterium]
MISVIIDKDTENQIINSEKKIIIKEKNDINHLKNSFRIKIGEKIRAVDGEFEYIIEVLEIEKKEIICGIIEKNNDKFSKETIIHSAVGMLKNDKMNLTIQKLTEIGIEKIIPYFSKRCIIKLNEKKDKWDLIAKEALKQCQGVKFVEIPEPLTLEKLDLSDYDLVIVPYEGTEEQNLKNIIKNLKFKPRKILYIIGPEGGFENSEIVYLEKQGAVIVTLGKRILRAETASIVVGGILINEFE